MFLKWAIIFAILALIAGFFGFTSFAAGTAGIAKALFIISLIGALIFVILGFMAV